MAGSGDMEPLHNPPGHWFWGWGRRSPAGSVKSAAEEREQRILQASKSLREFHDDDLFSSLQGPHTQRDSIHDIDSCLLRKVLSEIPAAIKKEYTHDTLVQQVMNVIAKRRRQSLEAICSNKAIQDLYLQLQERPFPNVHSLNDEAITLLVNELARLTDEWHLIPSAIKQLFPPVTTHRLLENPSQFQRLLEILDYHRKISCAQYAGLTSGFSSVPTIPETELYAAVESLTGRREPIEALDKRAIEHWLPELKRRIRDPKALARLIDSLPMLLLIQRRHALQMFHADKELCDLYQTVCGKPLQDPSTLRDQEVAEAIYSIATLLQQWAAVPREIQTLYQPLDTHQICSSPFVLHSILEAVYCSQQVARAQALGNPPTPFQSSRQELYRLAKTIPPFRNPAYTTAPPRPKAGEATDAVQTVQHALANVVNCQWTSLDFMVHRLPQILPLIAITPQGLAIRIPEQAAQRGFHVQLEYCLRQKGIEGTRRAIHLVRNGILYGQEVTIPLNAVHALLRDVLSIPDAPLQPVDAESCYDLMHDALAPASNYQAVHSFTVTADSCVPDIPSTIALSLSLLDPTLSRSERGSIAEAGTIAAKEKLPTIPCVEMDVNGLVIKIPEGKEGLRDAIEQIFLIQGHPIHAMRGEHRFSYAFQITRDEIPQFLHTMGMNRLPDHLPPTLAPYQSSYDALRTTTPTYLAVLQAARVYHPYRPTVVEGDPLASVQQSLATVVPNTDTRRRAIVPLVAWHPRGSLTIRFPAPPEDKGVLTTISGWLWSSREKEGMPEYMTLLKDFLHLPLVEGEETIDGVSYRGEIIVPKEQLERFVLDQLYLPLPVYEQLMRFAPPPYTPLYQTQREGKTQTINILGTIARSFATLDRTTQTALQHCHPDQEPGQATLLPAVKAGPFGLRIYLPKQLASRTVAVAEDRSLPLRQWLEFAFGLSFRYDSEEGVYIEIPPSKIKTFIERELLLNEVPKEYRREGCKTFYDELLLSHGKEWGDSFRPRRSVAVEGVRLKDPGAEPFSSDPVRFAILKAVEEWKMEILTLLVPEGEETAVWVPYLQQLWQETFGFNPPHHQPTPPRSSSSSRIEMLKQQFLREYLGKDPVSPYPNTSKLFKAVYEKFLTEISSDSSSLLFMLCVDRCKTLLKNQGKTEQEIAEKLQEWFYDEEGEMFEKMNPEVVEFLLTDAGILLP